MTATFDKVERRDNSVTVLEVTSDLVPGPGQVVRFHWYVDGRYVGNETEGRWSLPVNGERINQVSVDVVDTLSAAFDPILNAPDAYPVTRFLTWRRSFDPAVLSYVVSQDVGSGLEVAGEIAHDDKLWWYTWRSPVLPDLTSVSWDIQARGQDRNLGAPAEIVEYVVRTPTPPDWDLAWDSGTQRVTFSEVV